MPQGALAGALGNLISGGIGQNDQNPISGNVINSEMFLSFMGGGAKDSRDQSHGDPLDLMRKSPALASHVLDSP